MPVQFYRVNAMKLRHWNTACKTWLVIQEEEIQTKPRLRFYKLRSHSVQEDLSVGLE